MTLGLTLRTRLTLFVTVVFAVGATVLAIVAVDRIERTLVADTRSSAEAVLGQYLESINGGVATVGVVGDEVGAQFFYRDESGETLSEVEYFRLIASAFDAEFSRLATEIPTVSLAESLPATLGPVPIAENVAVGGVLIDGPPLVDPESGRLLDAAGSAITFVMGPVPLGSPQPVDLGPDVVAVSQTLTFPDGTSFEVGVSNPLRPVTDGLDAIRTLLWFAVPALVLAVAGITWLAATRALRPVHAISSRARAITADNLGDRLPIPRADDEVRELAVTVNDMLTRLEHSQRRQRELVADAAHELRSPVAASLAQLEVAVATDDVADWRSSGVTVIAEQERLSDLIDDLLALSRLDAAGLTVEQHVDLSAAVRVEAGRVRRIEPVVHTRDSADTTVVGDVRLLERAVGNLLDNASRHACGRVEVTVSRTTRAIVVDVDDDGPGVPTEDRERVFERFTRLDEARDRDRGGSGLGLAIVRDVARAHGGDVECSPGPLGGARFSVTIPAATAGDGSAPIRGEARDFCSAEA